jgi:DNA-binding transcriptional MocR family regulator
MLIKAQSQSLTGQLVERFAARIRDRLLAPGTRLPSIRECARQQGVSPHTVVSAYDQLLAQGLVQSRKNRGFFVREAPGRVLADNVSAPMGPSHATALIRAMFHGVSAKPQPGMGAFPPDWLAADFMSAALRKVVRSRALESFSLQYGEPAGDAGLRIALAQRLNGMDIQCAAQQIITTLGATQALDVVSRTLLRAGDPVMVEEPGWTVEFARLEALGMRILPVARGPNGPDLDVMARYCEAHAPKLFVSVSVLHNPTGHSLSPGRAHHILQLAHRYGFHVVEDDTYSHIAPEHATRLCALDGLRRTIYVSGFAKILAPNWRVGFLAAPQDLVERMVDMKLLSTLTTPALMEKAIAICIEQGQLRRHAERIRIRLDAARTRSVRLALAAGCRFASEPRGLFGWVDTGVDTDALAQRMLDEGYLLAPGALFHAARTTSTLMRINFTTTQDATFWDAFARQRRVGAAIR